MTLIELDKLTSPLVVELGAANAVALLPLGALEQHGPHLPLGTDTVAVEHLVRAVARATRYAVVVTPVLPIGASSHHGDFPGTLSIDESVLRATIAAQIDGLVNSGITRIGLISHHGGNFAPMRAITAEYRSVRPHLVVDAYDDLAQYLEVMRKAAAEAGMPVDESDLHAGAIETSIMLALNAGEVSDNWAAVPGYRGDAHDALRTVFVDGVKALTPNGVLGDPSRASATAGRAIMAALCTEVTAWLTSVFGADNHPQHAADAPSAGRAGHGGNPPDP